MRSDNPASASREPPKLFEARLRNLPEQEISTHTQDDVGMALLLTPTFCGDSARQLNCITLYRTGVSSWQSLPLAACHSVVEMLPSTLSGL